MNKLLHYNIIGVMMEGRGLKIFFGITEPQKFHIGDPVLGIRHYLQKAPVKRQLSYWELQ